MKAGWEVRALGEVCELIARGVGPSYIEAGGIAVLNQKCVRGHEVNFDLGRRHDSKLKRVNPERLVRFGDVLVNSTGTGTLGRVAQLRHETEEPTTVDTHVTIVRPATGKFYPEFFGYMMIQIEDELVAGGQGTSGQTELAKTDLEKKFKVSFPTDLDEQKRIVAVLDAAFEGLTRARAHTETNLQNARELFQGYLGEFFSGDGVGWSSEQLDEVVSDDCTLSYGIVQPGDEVGDGLHVVRPTDLGPRVIFAEGLKRIDPTLADSYRRTTLQGGELLLCVRGTTGTVAIASQELAGANVTRGIVPIRFDPAKITQELGYYLFRSRGVQDQVRAGTYGAALMQINIGDLRKIVVHFPPLAEQKWRISELVAAEDACESIQSHYRAKLADLDALRQSLLQKAFAGELT